MTETTIVYTTETPEEEPWYANVHEHALGTPSPKWDDTKCECGFDHEHHWISHEYTECDICEQALCTLEIERLEKENAMLKGRVAAFEAMQAAWLRINGWDDDK